METIIAIWLVYAHVYFNLRLLDETLGFIYEKGPICSVALLNDISEMSLYGYEVAYCNCPKH